MLRVAAALAAVGGLALLVAFLTVFGAGPFADPAARHLRAMKARTKVPTVVRPVTAAWMHALPHGQPPEVTAPIERGAVVLEGWVQRITWAGDGDIHLEVAPDDPGPDGVTHYVTGEITTASRQRHPGWRYEALGAALRPTTGSGRPWPGGPRRARVSGWLLYDFQHDAPDSLWPPGVGAPRMTGWEIHPVTRLEVFDAARGTWTEVGP